ncbi:MAG: AmmeMemoRadiSam system protein B [archaeon]|nr:MAG: AmmeMemoRadiSam system protein B [archaeon]
MPTRKPAVAGSFYPSDPSELTTMIKESYLSPLGPGRLPPDDPAKIDAVAVVSPHAGYQYSGAIAAHSYLHASSLRDPDLLVVVAPNHYGVGSGVSTFESGLWETPLGALRVDTEAASKLADACDLVSFEPESQRMEHSLEVQLPFLQHIFGDAVSLLPVSMLLQDQATAESVARGLQAAVEGRRPVIVASSDLTHYEPDESARRKDGALLEEACALDLDGFYSTLAELQVTACGYGPIATVVSLARALGLKRGELLKYATSGDTTGDKHQVVGYGSLRFVAS